jgi:DNA-binding IclR family transcriptional regulator
MSEVDADLDASGLPNEQGPVRTLAKGLAALDILMAEDDVRAKDLADRLGIDGGAASRLLQTLARAGYAQQGAGRRYSVGIKLCQQQSKNALAPVGNLKDQAKPLLEKLCRETGEAAYLSIMADREVLYLDKVLPSTPLVVERPIPSLGPRCCTAAGKLFTAINRMELPERLRAFADKTIVDREAYQEHINEISDLRYSWEDEEQDRGIRCVAVPLCDREGRMVAALVMAAPTPRLAMSEIERCARIALAIAADFNRVPADLAK